MNFLNQITKMKYHVLENLLSQQVSSEQLQTIRELFQDIQKYHEELKKDVPDLLQRIESCCDGILNSSEKQWWMKQLGYIVALVPESKEVTNWFHLHPKHLPILDIKMKIENTPDWIDTVVWCGGASFLFLFGVYGVYSVVRVLNMK